MFKFTNKNKKSENTPLISDNNQISHQNKFGKVSILDNEKFRNKEINKQIKVLDDKIEKLQKLENKMNNPPTKNKGPIVVYSYEAIKQVREQIEKLTNDLQFFKDQIANRSTQKSNRL